MPCPTNLPLSVTQPFKVQAVTFGVLSKCNVHLLDGLDVVYVPESADPIANLTVAVIATLARCFDLDVTVTYKGGGEAEGTSRAYCRRDLVRINIESIERGLIPWDGRDPE